MGVVHTSRLRIDKHEGPHRTAPRAAEEAEPVVEAVTHVQWRHRDHARRRKLDSQGKPVEAGADLGDHPAVVVGEFERRARRVRPGDEEGHGIRRPERSGWAPMNPTNPFFPAQPPASAPVAR